MQPIIASCVIFLAVALGSQAARAEQAPAVSNDVTQESPRERNRVLLKRNPIASEYQETGRLGLASGASADAEGVDFRSQFSLAPLQGRETARLETSVAFQAAAGRVEPGGRLKLGRQLGSMDWQLLVSSRAATRAISHYQSRWTEPGHAGESLSVLGFPRFSEDTYETRNRGLGLRVDAGEGVLSWFAETSVSRYSDRAYRNRLEYQVATGDIDIEAVSGRTITSASVANATIRRYFHQMDTTRDISRHRVGLRYEGDRNAVAISGYLSHWENLREWRPFNFADRDVDMVYRLTDPYVPQVSTPGYDIFDLSQSMLSNHRPSDLLTSDTDAAFRFDWDRESMWAGEKLWLSVGALFRTKARDIDHERSVFAATGSLPLSDVVGSNGAASILQGAIRIPAGLDIGSGLAAISDNAALVSRSDAASFLQTLQEIFTSEETVTGLYFSADQRRGQWSWEAGLRFESTRTDTLGNVTGPPDALAGVEGERVTSVRIDGRQLQESFDAFDAYRVADGQHYSNLLPSLALRYDQSDSLSWRVAAYQELMRPQYFDIVRYRRVNPPTRTINEGNPQLEPTVITNFAIAVEIGTSPIGKVALELYAKQIDDFFFDARTTEMLDGITYDVSRVENGEGGWIRGFQVQWSSDLESLLPSSWRGGIDLAYTWSDAEADLAGRGIPVPERSIHLLQTGVKLGLGIWTATSRLSYQSRALDSVGANQFQDIYRDDVVAWNNTLGLRFGSGWSARVSLVNVIDYPERSAEDGSQRVTNNQFSDYTLTATLALDF